MKRGMIFHNDCEFEPKDYEMEAPHQVEQNLPN